MLYRHPQNNPIPRTVGVHSDTTIRMSVVQSSEKRSKSEEQSIPMENTYTQYIHSNEQRRYHQWCEERYYFRYGARRHLQGLPQKNGSISRPITTDREPKCPQKRNGNQFHAFAITSKMCFIFPLKSPPQCFFRREIVLNDITSWSQYGYVFLMVF